MELIVPSCRESLSSSDKEFVAGHLTRNPADTGACHRLLDDPEERDRLLDGDALFEAILNQPDAIGVSQRLYFYILVRRVFRDAGIHDAELADYAATLLAHFAEAQRAFGSNTSKRQAFFYLVDALAEQGRARPTERFAIMVRLADQALFLTGIFPAHVEHRRQHRAAPGLQYYESMARSNYERAGQHYIAQEYCLNELYGALAEAFVRIRRALNHMADELIFLGEYPSLPELN